MDGWLFSYLFAFVYSPDTFFQNNLFIYLFKVYLLIYLSAHPSKITVICLFVYLFVWMDGWLFSYLFAFVYSPDTFFQNNLFIYLFKVYLLILFVRSPVLPSKITVVCLFVCLFV